MVSAVAGRRDALERRRSLGGGALAVGRHEKGLEWGSETGSARVAISPAYPQAFPADERFFSQASEPFT